MSLRPRRASTFFRKESRQRFARGAVAPPSNPHSSALRPISLSPRCWPAYAGLWAANRRQIRETLEKPRSKAQLFKRFCAKEDACALSLLSPFFWLLAGLAALWAANRRLAGKRPKSQGAKLSFSGVSVRWGRAGAFARPGKQEPNVGLHPEPTACVRGSNADTNTVRVLPTAGGQDFFFLSFAFFCLAFASQNSFHLSLRPRRASTFFRKESRQRFARGAVAPPSNPHSSALRLISPFPALLAGLTALQAAIRRLTGKRLKSQGAELSFSSVSVRKENACALSPLSPFFWLLASLAALRAANRRQIRETPEKPKEQSSAFRAFLCKRGRLRPFADLPLFLAAGRLSGPSGRKPPADKGNARKAKGAKLSFSGVSVRGGTGGPTFCVFIEVWRGLLPGRLPPGRREQEPGLFPCLGKQKPCAGPHLE